MAGLLSRALAVARGSAIAAPQSWGRFASNASDAVLDAAKGTVAGVGKAAVQGAGKPAPAARAVDAAAGTAQGVKTVAAAREKRPEGESKARGPTKAAGGGSQAGEGSKPASHKRPPGQQHQQQPRSGADRSQQQQPRSSSWQQPRSSLWQQPRNSPGHQPRSSPGHQPRSSPGQPGSALSAGKGREGSRPHHQGQQQQQQHMRRPQQNQRPGAAQGQQRSGQWSFRQGLGAGQQHRPGGSRAGWTARRGEEGREEATESSPEENRARHVGPSPRFALRHGRHSAADANHPHRDLHSDMLSDGPMDAAAGVMSRRPGLTPAPAKAGAEEAALFVPASATSLGLWPLAASPKAHFADRAVPPEDWAAFAGGHMGGAEQGALVARLAALLLPSPEGLARRKARAALLDVHPGLLAPQCSPTAPSPETRARLVRSGRRKARTQQPEVPPKSSTLLGWHRADMLRDYAVSKGAFAAIRNLVVDEEARNFDALRPNRVLGVFPAVGWRSLDRRIRKSVREVPQDAPSRRSAQLLVHEIRRNARWSAGDKERGVGMIIRALG